MAYRYPVHRRVNGWKIGEYDSIKRNGEILVGQLSQIDFELSIGTFRGFVIGIICGDASQQEQSREWKHNLLSSKPNCINNRYISVYERILEKKEL